MPVYRFTDPDTGQQVDIRAASLPTEAEVLAVFQQTRPRRAPLPELPGGPPAPPPDPSSFDHPSDLELGGRAVGMGVEAVKPIGRYAMQHPVETGALVGSAVATGGMAPLAQGAGLAARVGIPALLATQGGAAGAGIGAIGAKVRDYLQGKNPPPMDVGQTLGTMAKEGGAMGAATLGTGLAMEGLTGAGRSIYRGFLKPSLAANKVEKAHAIVDTALQESIPISRGGVQKAKDVIGTLKTQVDALIDQSDGTVDLHEIADKVRAFAKQEYFKPGVMPEPYAAALRVADSLDQHASLGLGAGQLLNPGPVPVSATAANESKRQIGKQIGEASFGVATGATKTAQKFAKHELRMALEGEVPQIAALNARESRLLDAAKAITRGVNREANLNPIKGVSPVLSLMAGGGAYAATANPAVAAATALTSRLGMSANLASRVAIAAYHIGQSMSVPASLAARLAVHAVMTEGETPTPDQPTPDQPQPYQMGPDTVSRSQ